MNYWENTRQFVSNFLPSQAKISYHGLLNQGATCYLNSVLQVLFMTKDFKEAVKRCTENPDTERTNCIDHHLKSLFDDLEGHQAYTFNITKKLGIRSVYEQQDAAEYFEKILGLTSPDASQIFKGQLTHQTTCSTCFKGPNADGAFWHLPLALPDAYLKDYSVVNGIDEFFRASDFTGDNQMYCEVCDAKSDATIKCVVKHHPEVLMLLLKRFKFDYSYMTYVKINCTVHVPHTLQIPERQIYELYAVVDHFGDLRSGHYAATIKSQDDERWYKFNDTSVTLLDCQPFQLDYIEKSDTAYLLFYRKKKAHAADTCDQDMREVSYPGDFPPATSSISDQGPGVVEMRGRAEFDRGGEAGNDAAVAVSSYTHEATGIQQGVHVEFRGVGLSPDPYNEENQQYARQSRPNKHQEGNEEGNGVRYQRDEVKITIEDEEDMRGKTSREAQPEQSVDHQDNDSKGQDDVIERKPDECPEDRETRQKSQYDQEHKQEVSDMHARHQRVCVDMKKGEEETEMGVNRDKDGKMESGEETERRGNASTKHHVRHNMYEDQEAGQIHDLKPVSVDTRGENERMEVVEQVDRERKSKGGRNLTLYDLCYSDIQSTARAGESEKKTKDDQRRRASSRFYPGHAQQIEEKRDVKGEKQHKREDDRLARRRGTSERQKQDQNRRSEDFSRSRSERVTCTAQARERKTVDNEQRRADSSLIRAGSSREGKNRGDAGFNADPKEGRCGLGQSKICHGQIIDKEFQGGVPISSKTENFKITTVISGGSIKSLVAYDERKSDPSTDANVTLSEGVCNIKLDDSQSKKRQKHRAERMPDAEVQAGIKHAKKKRIKIKRHLWRSSSPLKKKEKRRKTPGCFSAIFPKSKKNAVQTSESD